MRTIVLLLILSAGVLAGPPPKDLSSLPPASAKKVDYDKEIKPILTEHCFKCHGAEKQKGGLRLDDSKAALTGGNSGAVIVAGNSGESPLIHSVAGFDPDAQMPPGETKKLSRDEIALLRAWIDQGAKGPAGAGAVKVKSSHWSFQPPVRHEGTLDSFIRERLEKEDLKASPEADKRTLLRRVSLDLTGLPPSLKEIEDYLKEPWPQAYENAVDRLLKSPHYGERWARHWLDIARYADSDGYEKDTGRPFAWRYRDWVINALNADMPFNQFTIEQLAGDLLPDATLAQKTATGFHRNTLTNKEGGVDQEEFRVAAVVDRVNTTTTAWLGLTLSCCQCHDHKYDPFSQREFYQLLAFFNSDREVDLEAPLPGEEGQEAKLKKEFEKKKAVLARAVKDAKAAKKPEAEIRKLEKAVTDHAKKAPQTDKVQSISIGMPRVTHIHIRGDFLRKGVAVSAATPAVLPPMKGSSRLDLAKWLVSQENPLTPRVTVNWVWGKLFGRGLVATPEDFGTQGQKPSHPELLDWLAVTFRDDDAWSLKKLHKRIVMSATYRQSSALTPLHREKDPLNVLLARQSRLRLEAEIVRDCALSVSGLLNAQVGGPSIRPPQPPGISELTYASSVQWIETKGPEKYKRGLYIWFQRTSPYPGLMMFDEPDSNVCTVRRERSNTPLQALTLLNDPVFLECSQALAKAMAKEPPGSHDALFRRVLGREPLKAERESLSRFRARCRDDLKDKPDECSKLLGGTIPDDRASLPEAAAWVLTARAMMNLDEFVMRE